MALNLCGQIKLREFQFNNIQVSQQSVKIPLSPVECYTYRGETLKHQDTLEVRSEEARLQLLALQGENGPEPNCRQYSATESNFLNFPKDCKI